MKKVTFESQSRKNSKVFEIIEFTNANVKEIQIRAMALNWTIKEIERQSL